MIVTERRDGACLMGYNEAAGAKSPSASCIAETIDITAFAGHAGRLKHGVHNFFARFSGKKSVDPGACDTAKVKRQLKPLVYKGTKAFRQYNRSTDFLE